MKPTPFSATKVPAYVSSDVTGTIIEPNKDGTAILIKTTCVLNLAKNVLWCITAPHKVAEIFKTYWSLFYCLLRRLLAEKKNNLRLAFSTTCFVFWKFWAFIRPYSFQNKTVSQNGLTVRPSLHLWRYVCDHLRIWDEFTDTFSYLYVTRPRSDFSSTPFELIWKHLLPTLALEPSTAIMSQQYQR